MNKVLQLFFSFLKIGLFTFGGGYAMVSLIESEFVAKRRWVDENEFLDMIAIAESTPGPVAINSATYIGYKISGIIGATAATIAVCIPSFVIIYIISLFFEKFLSLKYVSYAFEGIQVCVIYLIFSAGIKMLKGLNKNAADICIISVTLIAMIAFSLISFDISSIIYILLSGVAGLVIYLIKSIKERGL